MVGWGVYSLWVVVASSRAVEHPCIGISSISGRTEVVGWSERRRYVPEGVRCNISQGD